MRSQLPKVGSLGCIALLCSPSLVAQSGSSFPSGPDVAIHEVVFSDTGDLELIPNGYSFHTDADGDGTIDVALWENHASGRLLRGGDCKVLFGKRDLLRIGLGPNGGKEAFVKTGVPFNWGGEVFGISEGYYGAAWTPAMTWFLAIWNLETGAFVKKLFLPPAPASGLPDPELFASAPMSVGDLDGDGFDEVLVNLVASYAIPFFAVAVLDGATLNYKWVQYYPTSAPASAWLINSWPTPCQDIDGDGTKDILLVGRDNGVPSSHLSQCVSGVDGSVIWSDLRPGIKPVSVIADVNFDGIRDLFYYQGVGAPSDPDGFFRVQSGQDGSVIWETNAGDYDPFYSYWGSAHGVEFFQETHPTGDVDGDGVMDIVLYASEFGKPALAGDFLWYLSGANGDLLSRDRMHPVPGYPWTDDFVGNVAYRLGDIDNDGWAEFIGVFTGEDLVHSGNDLIFFGRRTLVCQEEAQEGESVRVGLHMPNGAHKSFRLLLSTSFDPRDSGVHIGTWNTHLVSSPILSASLNTSILRGSLDARGMGSLDFRVPQGVGLIGKELFAVAIVEDFTRPSGVLTKSTVGVIKVLP